jgi:hypothetical protein
MAAQVLHQPTKLATGCKQEGLSVMLQAWHNKAIANTEFTLGYAAMLILYGSVAEIYILD